MKLYSVSDLKQFATTFGRNALEGATLTSMATFGQHLLKKYAAPSLTPLMDSQAAFGWTVAGALGYATYKTIVDPAYTKTNNRLS